jgi:hypothetical protein
MVAFVNTSRSIGRIQLERCRFGMGRLYVIRLYRFSHNSGLSLHPNRSN